MLISLTKIVIVPPEPVEPPVEPPPPVPAAFPE